MNRKGWSLTWDAHSNHLGSFISTDCLDPLPRTLIFLVYLRPVFCQGGVPLIYEEALVTNTGAWVCLVSFVGRLL